jgi:poly(hydroxyalkanoate) depolymerase family esterase
MNNTFHRDMLEATRLTRGGRLADATALLQRALRGASAPADTASSTAADTGAPTGRGSCVIDLVPDSVEVAEPPPPHARSAFGANDGTPRAGAVDRTACSHLPEALRSFVERVSRGGAGLPGIGGLTEASPAQARDVDLGNGGRFVAGSYSNEAGNRAYKLYIPSGYCGQALPLIVMLHGCTQSPDDFAAGTRMNALAEEHACFVLYPAQAASANASKCWNWFRPGDQRRDRGEPSLIAGITRQVMRDYSVDRRRIYVAGLSAGGAAAAVLGATYPDLYAAVGVHSGLACGAASDLPSAFTAMRQGGDPPAGRRSDGGRARRHGQDLRFAPAIVFHGDRDATVHPCNGDQVIAQFRATADLRATSERRQVPGGHAYSRTIYADETGRAVHEQWVVHGAGHAWSGGSSAGSYTDPLGPDAAREMLRFFLEHPHPTAPSASS